MDDETEDLRAYTAVHVLISMPVALAPRVLAILRPVAEMEGVTYEQSAN